MTGTFDPPIDDAVARYVHVLRDAGFESFESCDWPQPMVRFLGDEMAGFRSLGAAFAAKLPVAELRRVWPVSGGEAAGPWWELVFTRRAG